MGGVGAAGGVGTAGGAVGVVREVTAVAARSVVPSRVFSMVILRPSLSLRLLVSGCVVPARCPAKRRTLASRRGSLVVSASVPPLAALPPLASRLPPGAGKKAKKPEPKELELRQDGYLGRRQANGQAATVGADGDGGVAAVPVGLSHQPRKLLRWR
jgi:hypothetical protein